MPDPADLAGWLAELHAWDATQACGRPPSTVAYGDHPDQVADLWLPDRVRRPPVVVSLHGGYFRAAYGRDLHDPMSRELARRGFAVWNVEYRRAGTGGDFSTTTGDVEAAVDALAGLPSLDDRPVTVLGHSAGGYLAGWLASHPRVQLAVSLGGVLDLAGAVRAGWDGGGITEWLGASPDDDPDLYRSTELLRRLPTRARRVLIHGTADSTVGVEQPRAFAAADPDGTELIELEHTGHVAFLDPRQSAFQTLVTVLGR